jgi:hypothetical protein
MNMFRLFDYRFDRLEWSKEFSVAFLLSIPIGWSRATEHFSNEKTKS